MFIIFRNYEKVNTNIRSYEYLCIINKQDVSLLYNKNTFFERLSIFNVSNKGLSSSVGISAGNISDWKSGRSKPNIDTMIKIADYLDCSIDYLLGRTDNPEINKGKTIPFIHQTEIAAFGGETKAEQPQIIPEITTPQK